MRVLLATPPIDKPGGVANYYRTLRQYLPAEIEYFSVGATFDDERIRTRLGRLLRDYVRFFRKLRSGNFDLVHLNPSLVPNAVLRDGLFLLIAKALRKRVIVFMRGWDTEFERRIRRRFPALFRFVYGKADAFIVLASEFQSSLNEMGCTSRAFLETTVVDDAAFAVAREAREPSKAEARTQGLNILTLTRIEKAKGVNEAIETFRELKKKHPSLTLTVAGDGTGLKAAKEFVQELNLEDVAFPGFVSGDAKHRVFAQADIYLFPTYYPEGMPNSVVEAMAFGLPVVTRPVGGLRDLFENGRMGYLTESRDPKVFAKLLEPLLTDDGLRRRIGAFNRDFAWVNFRATRVAERLLDIYREVVGDGSTGQTSELDRPKERT